MKKRTLNLISYFGIEIAVVKLAVIDVHMTQRTHPSHSTSSVGKAKWKDLVSHLRDAGIFDDRLLLQPGATAL